MIHPPSNRRLEPSDTGEYSIDLVCVLWAGVGDGIAHRIPAWRHELHSVVVPPDRGTGTVSSDTRN